VTESSKPAKGGAAISRWVSWSSLWRGGLLAVCIAFACSSQLLFQFDLYSYWPLSSILLGWLERFVGQLGIAVCIFVCIALVTLIPTKSTWVRPVLLFIAITLGALAGELLILQIEPLPPGISVAEVVFARVARWLVIGGLAYVLFAFQRQSAEAEHQAHTTELQRIEIDRQLTDARLQSLRAQIEPHFLFNTLANVQQLYRLEPERGRGMLANFVAYLRAALPRMRHDETTLKQEVELARAYLEVLRLRMGDRLKIRFDIPADLAALAFPPLALSTLTENAIKHGLNPLPEGGAIEITARAKNGRLAVTVADTGAGLRRNSGSGTGLANLRARLAVLYGDAGTLAFETNAPRGIRATVVVPVRQPGVVGN
jgi:sensor histidine kinase YesM